MDPTIIDPTNPASNNVIYAESYPFTPIGFPLWTATGDAEIDTASGSVPTSLSASLVSRSGTGDYELRYSPLIYASAGTPLIVTATVTIFSIVPSDKGIYLEVISSSDVLIDSTDISSGVGESVITGSFVSPGYFYLLLNANETTDMHCSLNSVEVKVGA